jgi:hypothetical protein
MHQVLLLVVLTNKFNLMMLEQSVEQHHSSMINLQIVLVLDLLFHHKL